MDNDVTGHVLNLHYKGSRQYLHSTDIFDALTKRFDVIGSVGLKMRRFIRFPLVAIPTSDVPDPHSHPAHFSGETLSGRIDLVLSEDKGRSVSSRVPYDEEAIAADAVVEGLTIRSTGTRGTAIERIVALNKRLILECARPAKKLAFAQLSFSHPPRAHSEFLLTLESNIGTRLYRSCVRADDVLLGEIVFSGI